MMLTEEHQAEEIMEHGLEFGNVSRLVGDCLQNDFGVCYIYLKVLSRGNRIVDYAGFYLMFLLCSACT